MRGFCVFGRGVTSCTPAAPSVCFGGPLWRASQWGGAIRRASVGGGEGGAFRTATVSAGPRPLTVATTAGATAPPPHSLTTPLHSLRAGGFRGCQWRCYRAAFGRLVWGDLPTAPAHFRCARVCDLVVVGGSGAAGAPAAFGGLSGTTTNYLHAPEFGVSGFLSGSATSLPSPQELRCRVPECHGLSFVSQMFPKSCELQPLRARNSTLRTRLAWHESLTFARYSFRLLKVRRGPPGPAGVRRGARRWGSVGDAGAALPQLQATPPGRS
eukprot:gene17447-biopygen2327